MNLSPRLIDVRVPKDPAGVVLVLHGGASRRRAMRVSPTQLSVLRMIPIAHHITRRRDLAVFRVLNSARGWDTTHTPVNDARWALDQVAERLGARLPASLVGHSLGGRAALLTAGAEEVVSAVALAPWVYADDVARGVAGRRLLIVHGTEDRIARPDRAQALARNLARVTSVGFVTVEGAKHALLRHSGVFTELAAGFAAATLTGAEPPEVLAPLLASSGPELVTARR